MDFLELAQQLFEEQLLASEGTVRTVLKKYDLAVQHGPEYVGLVKNRYPDNTVENSRVYRGTDGSKIGILPIMGALVYKESNWEAMCGMTSYEGIQNKAEYMITNQKIDHLILELNSGGGMAYGCFETAQYVKNLAKEHGVKITSYVDGVAYSGGYAWCSIADEIVVNPMGKVGSIGVVLPLVNTAERDKKEGIKTIYITAGKSKVPFDEDGNFTKTALDKIQKDVMITYDMFVDHVADMRNISRETVIDTEANTFGTEESLKLGLIDQVMTKADFYKHLGNFNGDNIMAQPTDGQKVEGGTDVNATVLSQLSAQITTLTGEKEAFVAQITALTGERDQAVTALAGANDKITALNAELATAKSATETAKVDARKEAISALVSVDDVDMHMSFIADFDDAKFEQYKVQLQTSQEKLSKSFESQGLDTSDKEGEQVSVDSALANHIRERQGKNKNA